MNPIMALGAGIISAIAVFSIAFGTVLAFPLFYLAPLPLYLAGLAMGGKGVMFSVLGTICTSSVLGGAILAAPIAIGYGVPLAMTCRRALEHRTNPDGTLAWHPVGSIVAAMTAFGAGILALGGAWMMLRTGAPTLQESVASFLSNALAAMAERMPVDTRHGMAQELARYFPGMAAASWIVMHFANASIGQSILIRAGRNVRPTDTYSNIDLPDWMSWLLVGGAIIALAGPGDLAYVGHNLVIVLLVPFFMLGLAVVHLQVRRRGLGMPVLVVFYLFLVVFGWAAFAVAGIGIIEQWVGIRGRFPAGQDQE